MNFKKIIATVLLVTLSASASATPVVLNLSTDNLGGDTWFDMMDSSHTAVAFYDYTGPGSASLNNGFVNPLSETLDDDSFYTFMWDLDAGDYTFMIFDNNGYGLCCAYGSSSYELIVDGITVGSSSDFGSGMIEMFSIQAVAVTEPGLLALFGISLIGLGLSRRQL